MTEKKKDGNLSFVVAEEGTLLPTVRAQYRQTPSGRVKSWLEHRQLSVDGVVTTQYNYPVSPGQKVEVNLSGKKVADHGLTILYEDDAVFAINKPAGLLSVASDTEKERTAFRMLKEGREGALFVVHRLDRDTSGVLLFAKTAEIREKLQENWDKVSRREYLAVCEGVFDQTSGRCDSVLRETSTHLVYSVAQGMDGKRAITNYEVLRDNGNYSMVRLSLETGRKNQIRVHMHDLGNPIVGDKKYGAHGNPLKRLGLHASLLELEHPVTGGLLTIKAPIGRHFTLPKTKG